MSPTAVLCDLHFGRPPTRNSSQSSEAIRESYCEGLTAVSSEGDEVGQVQKTSDCVRDLKLCLPICPLRTTCRRVLRAKEMRVKCSRLSLPTVTFLVSTAHSK